MSVVIGFKGKRAGWQYWSGRAWTSTLARAAVMTSEQADAWITSRPKLNSAMLEKINVNAQGHKVEASKHIALAAKDFSSKTLRSLANKGIFITNAVYVFSDGEVNYHLDDNGTLRVRNYQHVLELAKEKNEDAA